jgi:hypothetical protein
MFQISGSVPIPVGVSSNEAMSAVRKALQVDSANRVEGDGIELRFERPELSGSRFNKFALVSKGYFSITAADTQEKISYKLFVDRLWIIGGFLAVAAEVLMFLSRRPNYTLPIYLVAIAIFANYGFIAAATQVWLRNVVNENIGP